MEDFVGSPAIDLTKVSRPLSELVDEAARSGEIVLTRGGEAVAKIVPLRPLASRTPGSARGQIHMAEDFDATPEDFKDYL